MSGLKKIVRDGKQQQQEEEEKLSFKKAADHLAIIIDHKRLKRERERIKEH